MDSVTSLSGQYRSAHNNAPRSRAGILVPGNRVNPEADKETRTPAQGEPPAHRKTEGSTNAESATKKLLLDEQKQIRELAERDREVRSHEQAHASAGGQYAGSPGFQYQRGPNGVNYAVGGHVSIDTSEVAGDPRATLQKAQVIRRAALAPAEPSAQDRSVAARASQMALRAQAALAERSRESRPAEKEPGSKVREGALGAFVDISV